jgi:hypothetical protein
MSSVLRIGKGALPAWPTWHKLTVHGAALCGHPEGTWVYRDEHTGNVFLAGSRTFIGARFRRDLDLHETPRGTAQVFATAPDEDEEQAFHVLVEALERGGYERSAAEVVALRRVYGSDVPASAAYGRAGTAVQTRVVTRIKDLLELQPVAGDSAGPLVDPFEGLTGAARQEAKQKLYRETYAAGASEVLRWDFGETHVDVAALRLIGTGPTSIDAVSEVHVGESVSLQVNVPKPGTPVVWSDGDTTRRVRAAGVDLGKLEAAGKRWIARDTNGKQIGPKHDSQSKAAQALLDAHNASVGGAS